MHILKYLSVATVLQVVPSLASPYVFRRDVANINNWDYFGCFSEDYFKRVLSSSTFDSSTMTVEACASFCNNYAYFGVEYGIECFCGATLLTRSVPWDETDCDFKCPGNNNQQCGGRDRLNIYRKRITSEPGSPGTTPVQQTFSSFGCFTDSTANRSLKGAKFVSDDMTVDKCATACKGWTYFGLEYSRECFCGSRLEQSTQVESSQCNMSCRGNSAQICGAGDRLNVYTYDAAPPSATTSVAGSSPSATTSPAPITAPVNPVVNGGFENGLAPWVTTDIRAVGTLRTTNAHTGAGCYGVSQYTSSADPEVKVGGIRQMVSIIPGRSYRVKLWLNSLSGQCTIDVYLANKRINAWWPATQPAGWTYKVGPATQIPANAPSVADFFVRFRCVNSEQQQMLVDDIELELLPA